MDALDAGACITAEASVLLAGTIGAVRGTTPAPARKKKKKEKKKKKKKKRKEKKKKEKERHKERMWVLHAVLKFMFSHLIKQLVKWRYLHTPSTTLIYIDNGSNIIVDVNY